MTNVMELPPDLPAPMDDGACDHLAGILLPDITLPSTRGDQVSLASLQGVTVLYIYPMTGRPGIPLPDGWDQIPGARGCTPQSCSFRYHYGELQRLGVEVYGLSTQSTSYQCEATERLHLPFALLSDEALEFVSALDLPTMEVEGMTLAKRVTLVCDDDRIKKVFYPVFPPDQSADQVLAYLTSERAT